MKKQIRVSIAIVFVLTILLSSTSYVIAAPLNGGPSISPSSGGGTATLTAIPVSKLPGTEANEAGTIFPIGHASGDMKFSGSGVQVSGLVGAATLSMPLASFAQGWTGSINQWLNGVWVALPTTITQNEESSDGTAAAAIYSNGIYALIIKYVPPVVKESNKCESFRLVSLGGNYDPPSGLVYIEAVVVGKFSIASLEGKTYNYKVISLDPSVTFGGDVSGTVYPYAYHDNGDGTYAILLRFPEDEIYVTHDGEYSNPPFIFRIYIDGCKVDYVVNGGEA